MKSERSEAKGRPVEDEVGEEEAKCWKRRARFNILESSTVAEDSPLGV